MIGRSVAVMMMMMMMMMLIEVKTMNDDPLRDVIANESRGQPEQDFAHTMGNKDRLLAGCD